MLHCRKSVLHNIKTFLFERFDHSSVKWNILWSPLYPVDYKYDEEPKLRWKQTNKEQTTKKCRQLTWTSLWGSSWRTARPRRRQNGRRSSCTPLAGSRCEWPSGSLCCRRPSQTLPRLKKTNLEMLLIKAQICSRLQTMPTLSCKQIIVCFQLFHAFPPSVNVCKAHLLIIVYMHVNNLKHLVFSCS